MANQQLVDYVKAQLAAGVTKADLQKAISTAGWSQLDSNDAFAVVEGKTPAASPSTPAVPTQPKPAQPVQPQAAQPVRPAVPMGQPTAQQPIANPNLGGPMRASTMQMNVQAASPRSHTTLWVSLAVIVLVVAGAIAAYLYIPAVQEIVGYYLNGGATPTQTAGTPLTPSSIATTSAQAPMIPAPSPSATSSTSTQVSSSTTTTATTSASTTRVFH